MFRVFCPLLRQAATETAERARRGSRRQRLTSSAQGVLALSPATTQAVRGFACDGFLVLSSAGPQLLRNCLGHSRDERRCGARMPVCAHSSPPAQLHTPRRRGLHTVAFTPWPSHRGLHTITRRRTRTHKHTYARHDSPCSAIFTIRYLSFSRRHAARAAASGGSCGRCRREAEVHFH